MAQALEYKKQLQALEPNVTYLMSLYLNICSLPNLYNVKKWTDRYPRIQCRNTGNHHRSRCRWNHRCEGLPSGYVYIYLTGYYQKTKLTEPGVTTNSAAGVSTYEDFFPVFAEMEKQDMVLNLHGEVPGTSRPGITDLNAEEEFLPTLKMLNQRFPKLRIVLEHCTTEAALNAVRECSESVGGTYLLFSLFMRLELIK